MRTVQLQRDITALVYDMDYQRVSCFKWIAQIDNHTTYAYAYTYGLVGGRRKRLKIYLHRFITNCPQGMVVHHRDHDGLNCQRFNLAIMTNGNNSKYRDNVVGISGYRGVEIRLSGKYRARITLNGKDVNIGTFDDPISAAKAYDAKAIEVFGPYALTNFVNPELYETCEIAMEQNVLPF